MTRHAGQDKPDELPVQQPAQRRVTVCLNHQNRAVTLGGVFWQATDPTTLAIFTNSMPVPMLQVTRQWRPVIGEADNANRKLSKAPHIKSYSCERAPSLVDALHGMLSAQFQLLDSLWGFAGN
jgi:hypothetical protein